MEHAYNKGRLNIEFEEGDKVLINPHTLKMLKETTGLGKKLTLKYDGPFEVSEKLSPITYRLRLPDSYKIHPVINIAHLEKYRESPPALGERAKKEMNREDFDTNVEYEVDRIVGEFWVDKPLTAAQKKRGTQKNRELLYIVTWKGYDDESYQTLDSLKNAMEPLRIWQKRDKTQDSAQGYRFEDPRKAKKGAKAKKGVAEPEKLPNTRQNTGAKDIKDVSRTPHGAGGAETRRMTLRSHH